jgi:3-oxosteroid 1-dehydrogenase
LDWDESYDFAVVGSGASAVVAALIMKRAGLSAVILEKQQYFGGTTAISGGVMWIPCNHLVGDRDSPEQAAHYFDSVLGDHRPASTPERRAAYVREAPRMVDFLVEQGMKFDSARVPDYYHGYFPGAVLRDRSIGPALFDMRRIGEWADRFGESWRSPQIPVKNHEIGELLVAKRSWKGRFTAARLGWRMLMEKLTGRKLRGGGRALQANMIAIALREGLPISMATEVRELVMDGGRVAGVVAVRDGREVRIEARRGVLLNAGGFSHNQEMREAYLPQPTSAEWTLTNPGDTGEGIRMATAIGAATDMMDSAWWVPTSMPVDASKPHFIVVNKAGKRFCNESKSYAESGWALYKEGAVPAFGVFDSQFRSRYTLVSLMLQPFGSARAHIESGKLVEASTIPELAAAMGIDPAGLEAEVARFNGFARSGKDEDFRKGDQAYDRHFGDPGQRPNPCLGMVSRPPYYAIRIWPVDVGTCGGLLTDEHARVLREDGSVLPGLYATGNTTASVMGGSYVGAGSTIGPSLTFGYIAAKHAAGTNRL